VLAIAAATAARNVAFFAVVAAPVLSMLWASDTLRRSYHRSATAAGYVLISAAVVAAVFFVSRHWQGTGARLGWRPLSSEILQAVRQCPDPMFNHMENGGYLTWAVPEKRVFVDSRVDVFPVDFLLRSRAADLEGEYRTLFHEYGIRCALVAKTAPLHKVLLQDASMAVTFADPSYSVFARVSPG
jgi:hypothetical protein